jgi:hypothetical protein
MHAGCPAQRHAERGLTRWAAPIAAAALVAGALLGTGAAAAGSGDALALQPATAVLGTYQNSGFTASWTASGASTAEVLVNGAEVAKAAITQAGPVTVTVGQLPGWGQPGSVQCGANTVAVESTPPGGSAGLLSATLTAQCPFQAPAITVSPDTVGSQQAPQTFLVSPQNFFESSRSLFVDNQPQPATEDRTGNVSFQAALGCGKHFVMLAGSDLDGGFGAASTITVTCTPQITVSPPAFRHTGRPVSVAVTGGPFYPGQPVTISIDGQSAGTGQADGSGGLRAGITVPGSLGCGPHQVTASQQGTSVFGAVPALTASAPLTETGCRQTLVLDPAVLEPGEVTHVTGTGFTPAQPVTLTWRTHSGGMPVGGPLSVVADGHGHIGAFDLVMPGAPLGPCQLVATQAGTTVAADAIIDGGPMQPASGGRLLYRGN